MQLHDMLYEAESLPIFFDLLYGKCREQFSFLKKPDLSTIDQNLRICVVPDVKYDMSGVIKGRIAFIPAYDPEKMQEIPMRLCAVFSNEGSEYEPYYARVSGHDTYRFGGYEYEINPLQNTLVIWGFRHHKELFGIDLSSLEEMEMMNE